MRIVGVDCGAERTGYGVIDSDGRRHRLQTHGVIRTSAKQPLAERLQKIYTQIRSVLETSQPDRIAVETVFAAVNPRSSLLLAHVRGVVLLAGAEQGVAVAEYSPLEIKTSVVGYGRADKRQVQMMVASLLGLPAIVEPHDASDALAAAICDVTRAAFASRMRGGGVKSVR
ncbi:MAG: crossover junction endodeoxyribonuclease RuvC [Acidobacteria bacterium]|nr:crossover junction endodeoxyribonuclease RuvC [Acidobacteriota bacterium]